MKRQTASKDKIKAAFIELIHEVGFDSLTVSDLARRSSINRGTFYLHYVDKFDLMDQLEEEIMDELEAIFFKEEYQQGQEVDALSLIPYAAILEALQYVESQFTLVQALASPQGDPHFMIKVKDILSRLISAKVEASDRLNFPPKDLPLPYAKEVLLSSVVSIIRLWIQRGGQESPEDIAQFIDQAKRIPPYQLIS
ncbi:TetR/AcrR family transcriptional regulator [Aerococcus sanguinicola]|uniref:TetR/AcrR family transcriptional regulator n=1 Tax=unclassified Aerococcus TaxID=2618060 RepID=UPI0008A1F1C7|nr:MULTISPECIES: TetR/AcrR family transcriptional regulator [unclassified Aerococcus]KAB0647942.1 TetR/AcrR family transcriptional regulator [Aerococcus sanguinicola]MDK6233441.1 TetR/AcrR family transcriptional regulator [Aerococcus sp. UMB10185]MDK6855576.1 TetR/AcrR family transcriptional regulator [Aerococcus sp. UMB7533]MDK8502295.1 TetR/AcrR family transcriptional regulator [Aerococcus sp. UMB1112A]OFN02310.1 TetR family transcriptional regulator [Aerococcus sp. HMSC062A02]